MKPLFSQKFAILTADNPRYGSAEGGNVALEQEMKTKGLKFTPMKGKYGTSENSYLVENPDHQDILSWGKKYGQDSVIVSDGGHHKMVYTNGPHEGLWHEGHSVSIHDKEPEDFYSTINLNGKPTHFTIDFDMDTKHSSNLNQSKSNELEKAIEVPDFKEKNIQKRKEQYKKYVRSLPKTLFHSTTVDSMNRASQNDGWIEPSRGPIVSQVYKEKGVPNPAKGVFMSDEENDHGYYSLWQLRNKLGREPTKEEFLNHAAIAYIDPNSSEGWGSPHSKIIHRPINDSEGEKYIQPFKNNPEDKKIAHGEYQNPIRFRHVEPGDYFSNQAVKPFKWMHGQELHDDIVKNPHKYHKEVVQLINKNESVKKSLTKMLKSLFTPKLPLYSEYVESLEKSEKLPHFLKFMGDHPKAQETAQWADDNIKHRNLAELAMRYAKTKPEGLSEEEKTHIKHFNDSLHMPEVQKAAGMLGKQHDFHSGINMLKDAEAAYQKRHAAEAPTLVPTEGIKVLDFGDGVGVYNLGKSKNENEATGMGHCATPHKGGELWSIRRDHGNGMVEPLVTISHEGGYIGEMKGKHNWKPSEKHHIHIAKLLASDKIKGFVGGGYAPESNFEISDLKEGLRNKLLEHKPSLVQQVYKETLPRGFQGDYSHVPEIKSIFNTNNLEAQKKYLQKFSKDIEKHIEIRRSVAKNPNTHPDILRQLSTDNQWNVRYSVAQNPNTHSDILHKLSTDSDGYVRRSVAENPNTHPDILRQLSTDNQWNVRGSVAENPNTHSDILHKLSTDSDGYVRRSVAKNPNTHSDILHKLSTDSYADVRGSVAENPNTHSDILHKLSTDSDGYVRRSVAKNPNTHSDILHKLSTDSYADVRGSVAKNPNTHSDILHKLSTDSYADVRGSVAENPQFKNLPPEIQQNVRPLIKTNIQKIIAMINDGERNPDAARKATEELKIRRKEKYDKILSPEGNLSDIQHLAESHDKDIAKRAREELKRRGLQKSLKKSDSPKHLIHFSTTPNLTTLDPEFQGTAGRHSPETKHGKPTHPRVYFYEEGTPTESVVTGGAKSKYVVKHPGHDKIIDIANDLENQQQAKQQWLQKPIGSVQDAYFKLLKDKGYLGFKNSASGLPNVVALFHATPVHAEIPMPKDMAANKDWTEASVPMSLKKSDVKEAVEAIKGPAKVNEVLAEAKPDMRSKILSALRKEKLAKMNGTGTPGAGGATPPMMRPPVPAAPASMAMSKADESESRMAKKDLKDIIEYAQALDKMVVESEDLEDWVDSKITVARQYLSDIAHYLSYEHGQPTEELDKAESKKIDVKKLHPADRHQFKILVDTVKNPTKSLLGGPSVEEAKKILKQKFNHTVEELDKGDVISMKDKKVISTDTKAAPKELVAQQPKAAKNERALAQRVKSNWEGPRPELAKSEDLEKGDVVSMKDRKVISTDTKAAPKKLVAQQPKAAAEERIGNFIKVVSDNANPASQESVTRKPRLLNVSREGGGISVYAKTHPIHDSLPGVHAEYDFSNPKHQDILSQAIKLAASKGHGVVYVKPSQKKPEAPSLGLAKSEDLEKGDVVSMKDRKVISTDTKAAPKKLVAQQPTTAKEEREGKKHPLRDSWKMAHIMSKEDHEEASEYHSALGDKFNGQSSKNGNYNWQDDQEKRDYHWNQANVHDFMANGDNFMAGEYLKELKKYRNPYEQDKNSPKKPSRPELAKSDSKKAKFERCVLAVKKKSGDKVNPWAVCHASVDGAKKSEDLEKADMKVKEQEKPTKGMPQAKQLKADADLEKIKEGAENVAKAADKKKSELNKSGYFKEDKKTQLPKWHDPLKEQRESAAQEEQELRPDEKMHIWAELEREHQQADKAKTQKPKEELKKKIILGEGKPSKATKKATPEEHKAIMDKLSTALDTVKVDTSPEAIKERKILLEHVKHKLKGRK